eukprot:jgi/Bigna1/92049/estExt_fgenesh1_pg.C_2350001
MAVGFDGPVALLVLLCAQPAFGVWENRKPTLLSSKAENEVLMFTKSTGYAHESTPFAAAFLARTAQQLGFRPVVSNDSTLLEKSNSDCGFDAIVFVSNTGQLFDTAKEHLSAHIAAGKGVLGLHSVIGAFRSERKRADGTRESTYSSNLMEDVFGAHFAWHAAPHPPACEGTVTIAEEEGRRLGLEGKIDFEFSHHGEFFNFDKNPADTEGIVTIATVDESSYDGGSMGEIHPVVWRRELGDKHAPIFYCGLGHGKENYDPNSKSEVKEILEAGMKYVLGVNV